jgi:membrane protein
MVKKTFSRLRQIASGVHTGAEHELNRLDRFAHFCMLVASSFNRNRCPVRAAALSYATLLALIPMLAVAMSITSSLLKNEGQEKIYQAIDKFVSNIIPPGTNTVEMAETSANTATNASASTGAPAIKDERVMAAQEKAASYIHQFIQKTQSSTLGVVGMLTLIYVAIMMLANIEATFNDIWGVTRGRTWLLRIILYWTTITLGPLALVAALGLASGKHWDSTRSFVEHMPLVGNLIFQLLPPVVLWFTFALLYMLVPNTKVKFSAALFGGIVAGSLWHLNYLFGFLYASRLGTNSTIYGGLGLVPVFMAGLYLSWLVLLFGAQIAYAFQNRHAYLQDKIIEHVNQREREFIALRLMTAIAKKFQAGQPPASLPEISADLAIPSKLVQQVLQPLLLARLVTEIVSHEHAYTPARPLEAISAHDILYAMRTGGRPDAMRIEEPVHSELFGEFARIADAERHAAAGLNLSMLVARLPATPALPPPSPDKKLSSSGIDT